MGNSNLTMTTILLLSFALFFLAILLLWNNHRLSEIRDYVRNIHSSIGLPDDLNTDLPRFMDQVRQIRMQEGTAPTMPDSSEILKLIAENAAQFYCLLHATFREEDAMAILEKGLKYEDDLYKTSLQVSADPVDIKYKLQLCKQHGAFIALICIPQELFRFITEEMKFHHRREQVEIFLSEKIEDGDFNFLLPNRFIKGYVDIISGGARINEQFMNGYEFMEFKNSIQKRLDTKFT